MRGMSLTTRLVSTIVTSGGLGVAIAGLGAASASAQLVIQSTGTVSGKIQLPSFNPNFNRNVTRVDTDASGTYYRHGVPVYTSNYVKMQTNSDGTQRYYVDFKGIPVVSFDGVLTSPALSGDLTPYSYQGKLPGTRFQGVVQDEFGLTKAFYTGMVIDPKTGQQYQGTFKISGQGPRYSDKKGGASPTVFDFKSDLPGSPTVKSYVMTNTPLVRLTIEVPAGTVPITPGGVTTGGGVTSGGAVVTDGDISTGGAVVTGGDIPTNVYNPTDIPSGIDSSDTISTITDSSNPALSTSRDGIIPPATDSSPINSNSFGVNAFVSEPEMLATAICSQSGNTAAGNRANCGGSQRVSSGRVIGPRSRVLLR